MAVEAHGQERAAGGLGGDGGRELALDGGGREEREPLAAVDRLARAQRTLREVGQPADAGPLDGGGQRAGDRRVAGEVQVKR